MKRGSTPDDPIGDREVERIAADWIGRRDAGLTAGQEAELEAWLKRDPRHAAAFDRLAAADDVLDRLQAFRPPGTTGIDPDLPLRPRGVAARAVVRRGRWRGWAAAAAGVLAIAAFGVRQAAVDASGFRETAVTEVGGLKKLNLPDGSVVDLNTDSAVKVAFTKSARWVELVRGEAHFAVAKDSARPFVVRAGGVAVRAVGTAFNVRVRAQAVEVLVTEGRVGVRDSKHDRSLLPETLAVPQPVLEAGQHAVISAADRPKDAALAPVVVATVSLQEIAQRLAWQAQRLEFDPTPLKDVIAEFNRYSAQRLVIADAECEALSIGGSFRVGDWETLVRLLQSNFGVEAERRGGEVILRKRH